MKVSIYSIIILLSFGLPAIAMAQHSKYTIYGTVKDAKTNSPVTYANIHIDDVQTGTISNEKGVFFMKNFPEGTYTLTVSHVGYQTANIKITLTKDAILNIALKVSSLQLSEVSVMASARKQSGSSVTIDKTAMEYIQPTSLGDIMQLLPGQLTKDGTLTGRNQLLFRQAESDNDKSTALGAPILLDGVPLSNNANLQNIGYDNKFQTRNTLNKGIDLRMLSTDHIETAEVVQGIPSVKYGDLSSGMIITKPKSGNQPLSMRIKANPNGKLIYAGRGFQLPEKWGAVHAGIDYTDARPDVRQSLTAYKRYSLNLNYTNVLSISNKPLQLGLNATHIGTLDATKNDPDLTPREDTYKAIYNRLIISQKANWQLAKPWLSSLAYLLAVDMAWDKTIRTLTVSPNGVVPLPTSKIVGEAEGVYLPAEYVSNYTMKGRPVSLFAQINGKTILPTAGINHVLQWGAEFRHEKNYGEGFAYDILRPPYPTSNYSSRPRKFSDIPASQHLSAYIEDKMSGTLSKNAFEIAAGLRFTNLPNVEKQYQSLYKKWFVEPRINAWWKFPTFAIFKQETSVAIKAGYGEAVKFPTLDMLSPEPNYDDFISLNYFSQKRENSLLWVTTIINNTKNPALKPNRNRKAEAGLDFFIGKMKMSLLVFKEISNQGYQDNPFYFSQIFNRYRTDQIFDYKPDISQFEQYADTLLNAYSIPVNGEKIIKTGIEYSLDFPRIKAMATSISINGAYYHTTYDVSMPIMRSPSVIIDGKPYKFVGIYGWDRGEFRSRFNTNVWCNTHIPQYRLIFTTKIQSLWFTNYQTKPFSGMPIYYFGIGKEKTPFAETDKSDPYLRFLVQEYSERFFYPIKTPVELSIDLKATKEITDNIKLSFYANRLFYYSPLYYSNLNTPIRIRHTPYFGAEIEIKF